MRKIYYSNLFKPHIQPITTLILIFLTCSLNAQTAFISTWQTNNPGTSDSTSIAIPTYPNKTYNYDIDWDDDGVYDTFGVTGDTSHNYSIKGTYTIRIRGEFAGIYFNSSGDKDKIIDIEQWGSEIQWKAMDNAFTGCTNLNISASDAPNLSEVSSLQSTFRGCTSFNSNINHWDVSTISSFYFTLSNCPNYNQPLDDWDMSSATNLTKMFQGANAFDQPLNSWDVSNVTQFGGLFHNCFVFNRPLDNWDTQNAVSMARTFSHAYNFNQDISNWNLSKVTTISGIFTDAITFNQDISNWDVSKVTDMSSAFKGAKVFNYDIGDWDVSKVSSMQWIFAGASEFNQDIGDWDVSQVTNMNYLFFYASKFNQDISNWNVGNVELMQNTFKAANAFNQDIGDWDVSKVTSMNSMFEQNEGFDQNLANWDVSKVTSMNRIFNYAHLSTANYDSLLIAWSTLELQDSVNFHGGNSIYCVGWEARAFIQENFGWAIEDKGHDQTAPVSICKNININLTEEGHASISPEMLDNGSSGNCSTIVFEASKTTFDCSDVGILIDTLWVSDALDNTSFCLSTITVIEAPFTFNCPADIIINTNTAGCKGTAEWEEFSGDCSRTVSSNFESGSIFPLGTTEVKYLAVNNTQDTTNTCSFNITVIDDLALEITDIQNPRCHDTNDGFILLSTTGTNAPFTYDWDMDGIGDFDDAEDQDNLAEGNYQVRINDIWGCSIHQTFSLINPAPIQLSTTTKSKGTSSDLFIDLNVEGGIPPYQYDWDNDGTGDFDDPQDLIVSHGGLYTVTVIDANDCRSVQEVEIEMTTSTTDGLCIDHHLTVSPNPSSGVFRLDLGTCVESARLEIYDTYGRLVYHAVTSANHENINLEYLPEGAYFLSINSTEGTLVRPMVIRRP